MQERDWNKEWRGLEPEQPKSGKLGCWLGVLALLFIIFGTCFGTIYFAWRQLDLPIDPGTVLTGPTIPPLSTLPPIDRDVVGTAQPAAVVTRPPMVATATLPIPVTIDAYDDVEARRLAVPASIDGNLGEWADIAGYESSYRVYNVGDWDQSDDVLAFWRLGWDEENLYAAVQIEDDTHVQTQQGNTIYNGDGVSLQIDTQRAADFGPALSPDDFQVNLSPGDFAGNPAASYLFRGANDGSPAGVEGHGIQLAALRTRGGYTIEAAIPWQDLGISPTPGMRFGIALNVNDNDTPGTAVQEVMKSHVATRLFSDPTSWGTIILR